MKNWQHNYVCGFFINAISGRWHRLHLYGFEASSIAANCVSLIQFLRYRAERHCCQYAVRGNIIIRCEWKLRISSLLVLPASLFLLLLLRFFVLFFKKASAETTRRLEVTWIGGAVAAWKFTLTSAKDFCSFHRGKGNSIEPFLNLIQTISSIYGRWLLATGHRDPIHFTPLASVNTKFIKFSFSLAES